MPIKYTFQNFATFHRMYRAIPEVSRICSMQERSLKYKQHLDALNRIHSKPSDLGLPPVKSKRSYNYTLRGKAKREELARINYENQKMKHAIVYRPSSINRADFKAHELEHEYQVHRLTSNTYSYGFQSIKPKRYHSSLTQSLEPMPSETKPKETPSSDDTKQEQEISEPINVPPKKTSPQQEPPKKTISNKPIEQPLDSKETTDYSVPSNQEQVEEIEAKEAQPNPEPKKIDEEQQDDQKLEMIDIKDALTGD